MNILTQDLLDLLELREIDSLIFQGNCTQVFGSHLFG